MQFATFLEKKETISFKLLGLYLVQWIVAGKALHNWINVIILLLPEESDNESHMTDSFRNMKMQKNPKVLKKITFPGTVIYIQ